LILLHLLLDVLLRIHRRGANYGLVFLQVVNKLPLFVLSVIVDHVNSFAFRRACHARDSARVSGSKSTGGRGRLARLGKDLLDQVGRTLRGSALGRRRGLSE
jgi:hypothetical protein